MDAIETDNPHLDIIWGAAAIGREIGKTPRQTFNLLESGAIPAARVGGRWCSDRSVLRRTFHEAMINRAASRGAR
jgi:hypothetical protein